MDTKISTDVAIIGAFMPSFLIKIECNSDPIVKIFFTRYPFRAYQQPPLRHELSSHLTTTRAFFR